MTYFHNPHADTADAGSIIEGRRKQVGEKVLKTSRYASTEGTWNPPGNSVGVTIQSEKVIWVEPTRVADPKQPRLLYKAELVAK